MNDSLPQYFLLVECVASCDAGDVWRFVLCHQGTGRVWTAKDAELGCGRDRLAVLALVRGLEALTEPAKVKVVTSDRHIRYALERGLRDWSANSWKWERFGRLVTVRNDDLWRRVHQTLQIHQVECRSWRVSVTDHNSLPITHQKSGASLPSEPTRIHSRCSVADSPDAFSFEPALLVVRKPRRTLRVNPSGGVTAPRQFAHTAAG